MSEFIERTVREKAEILAFQCDERVVYRYLRFLHYKIQKLEGRKCSDCASFGKLSGENKIKGFCYKQDCSSVKQDHYCKEWKKLK
jgi:hypothetical protein